MTISTTSSTTARLSLRSIRATIIRPGFVDLLHRWVSRRGRDALPNALIADVDPNRVPRPGSDLDLRIRPHLY